ncbi:hypothetical protein ACN28S_34910 [Cystobacter fuscus]
MSTPLRFVWSSRSGIRAQLLSFLDALPAGDFDARVRVLRLLRLFGGEDELPLVRALLLNPREHFTVRSWALGLALHLGLRLSGAELSGLVGASALRRPRRTPRSWRPIGACVWCGRRKTSPGWRPSCSGGLPGSARTSSSSRGARASRCRRPS